MVSPSSIQFLSRNEIDIEKWNECIANAANGLIYSYAFYLDALCDHWDAFVINDYEAVMPLTWKRKAGIKYLYTPPFIQQLGVTGSHTIFSEQDVLEQVGKLFRYGDILFNYSHSLEGIPTSSKTNFILNLNQPFSKIEVGFSHVLKKNLKAARKTELYISSYSHKLIIKSFRNKYQERMGHVRDMDYNNFSKLCDQLLSKNMLATKIIQNREEEILAAVVLAMDDKRVYNLINHVTATGRKAMANHVLMCETLKEFSGRNLLFDFEGSDLPGVKEFYKYFSPVDQPYFHYHFNYLPFPLNLVKK